MNTVIMIGRLTKDVELRYTTNNNMAVARFCIAVNRPFAKKDDEIKADFFNVVVWGNRAQTCANYLRKGLQVALQGRLQNNNYKDKDNKMKYSIDIIADTIEFIDYSNKKEDNDDVNAFKDEDVNYDDTNFES